MAPALAWLLATALQFPGPVLAGPHAVADARSLPRTAQRVLALRAAEARGDSAAIAALLAPDSRVWFEARVGPGERRDPAGKDGYADWDRSLHAAKQVHFVRAGGDSAEFALVETNDFYRLIERDPSRARLVYWFDDRGRIAGTLVQSLEPAPGAPRRHDRLPEFKAWMAAHDSTALADLLPGGHLAHDLAHARRWRQALVAWRRAAGLPEVPIPAP